MTQAICPRCESTDTCVDHRGQEDGKTLWSILRCVTCCFSWRDSEPDSTIVVGKRSKDFAVDASNLDKYPKVLQQ